MKNLVLIGILLSSIIMFQGCSSKSIDESNTVIKYKNKGYNFKNIIYSEVEIINNCPSIKTLSKKEVGDTKLVFKGCMSKKNLLGEVNLYLEKGINPIVYNLEIEDLITCNEAQQKDSTKFGLINTKQIEGGIAKQEGAFIKVSVCKEALSKKRTAINHIIDLEYY